HDANGRFPPGYVSGVASDGEDTGPGWGWAAQVLPQMEQSALANSIRFDKPIEDPVNATPRVTKITPYLCPADDAPPTWWATRYDPSGKVQKQICQVAGANYVGVFGKTEPGVDGEGIFFRNSKVAIKDITDGTSQTLLVGERTFKVGPATWVGSVTGATLYQPATGPQVEGGAGMALGVADRQGPSGTGIEVNAFASLHPGGGANFVFADGH